MRAVSLVSLAVALGACTTGTKPVGTATGVAGNVAPTLASAQLTPDPATEQSVLTCTGVGATDGDGDTVNMAYAWYVNEAEVPGEVTQTLTGSVFDKGNLVYCVITPDDGTLTGTPVTSNTVEIQNSPPTGVAVDVAPNPATPTDTLVATATGWADADPADSEDWNYDWFVNGTAAGSGGASLAGEFAKGDEVYVVATPYDGVEEGNPVQSDIVNILNTPPSLTAAQLTPIDPILSDLLTCTPVGPSDPDGDPVTFTYAWFVDGNPAGSGTDILADPQFANGNDVYCVITPTDGEDDGTPVQSNTVTVQNSAPTIGSVTLAPNPATELDTLTCSAVNITDPDGDAVALSFAWTVAGFSVPGATSSTLTGANFDKGQGVYCTVTATDGNDASPPTNSNTVVIANTPPTMTSGVITPTPVYTLDTANVAAYGWADVDGDSAGYQYQWLLNGSPVAGAVGSSLGGGNFAKHDLLSVEITPDDGDDLGPPVLTPEIEVWNTPPTAPTVTVTPLSPDTSDTLLCGLSVASSDDDSDPIGYSYSWNRNGTPSGHVTNTVPGADTALGDNWTCFITPNDGEEDGTAGSASVVIIDGTAPLPPVLDAIDRYRNEADVFLTGSAEASSLVTLYAVCDGLSSGTDTTNASPTGDFDFLWTLTPGETCDFYVTATDLGGNVSPNSNTVTTTRCGDPDPWESVPGQGDDSLNAVDAWGPLADDGTATIILEGNLLDQDAADWFVVHTTDNVTADRVAGRNDYDFHALLTAGAPDYTFLVYEGSVSPGNLECPAQIDGYDEYSQAHLDSGDAPDHVQANPRELCGLNSPLYNECESLATSYYIRVLRDPNVVADCTNYEITITNNAP